MSLLLSDEELEACRLLAHERDRERLAKRRQEEDDRQRMELRRSLREDRVPEDQHAQVMHDLNTELLAKWRDL